MIWIFIMLACYVGLLYGNVVVESQKKYIAIIILCILCILSGTRYYMGGSDYYAYQTIFEASPTLKGFSFEAIKNNWITQNYEVGYIFLNSIIKSLGFSFYGFTLIHSIVFYLCMYYGLKRYINEYYLFILLFLYKLFFYNTFVSMRQSITIAIFFCALHLIQERKAIKYFICCAIAVAIHNGAWILFGVYFINNISLTKQKLFWLNIFFVPTIVVSYLNISLLGIFRPILKFISFADQGQKIDTFIDTAGLSSIDIFHTLEYFLIMILVYIFFEKLKNFDENAEFILKLFLLLLPLFTLFRGYEILTRMKDYFTLSYAIILGYLCMVENRKFRTPIQIGAIILCTFGFFRFAIAFNNGEMMNYKSYLFKGISIFQEENK